MNKANTGLGRGFDGLIPSGMSIADVAVPGEQIKKIETSKIFPNPDQPRKTFDEVSLSELADSIKQLGVIQPLVVTPADGGYRIVAGERRWRASVIAKISKVPVLIRNPQELEELEIAIVENVQRVDLSPLETALSIVKLRDQFSLPISEISKKLGKAETTVSNILRLLRLPKEAIEALQNNEITEGHARAILALKTDEKLQKELLNKIITQKLNVRQAENFVQENRIKNSNNSIKIIKQDDKVWESVKPFFKDRMKLSQNSKGGGNLTISYVSKQDLEEILKSLK